MPEALSRLQQKVLDFWNNLEKSQKNRIYITSAILIIAIAVGIVVATRPNKFVLVRDGDTKEIGEIVKILEDKKIWNQVSNDHTSISIDAKDNDKVQAILAQSGYPKSGGVTIEDTFNKIKFGTTESDKKKLWEDYDIKKLESMLRQFDNVQEASVALSVPEKPVFMTQDQEQKPTAVVSITPKAPLTKEQVRGITLLMARAVEKLDPKDVTVVDNNLNVLSDEVSDDSVASANSQEEMRSNKAKELEKKIYNLFQGQTDSFDGLKVSVNPVLDFNKQKSQIHDIANPDGMESGAVISQEKTKEKLVNSTPGSEPGMATNPGSATPSYQTGDGQGSSYDKQGDKTNYQYKETETQQEKAIGELLPDKSSIAITLYYGKKVVDANKLDDQLITDIKNLASGATGIPAAKISISRFKIVPNEVPAPTLQDTVKGYVDSYGLFALLLILTVVLAIVAMPRKRKETEPELAAAQAMQAAASGPRFIVPDGPEGPVPEIEMEERSEVKKQIEKFVKQKPEAVAQLLRNWLQDDWD